MLSIKKIKRGTIVAAALAGLFWAAQALAHETRTVGPYKFVIGFRNEPAFVSEPNAADIFVSRASDNRPIDRSAGDVVDLQVEVQLRDREAFDSKILRVAELEDPLTQAFQTPNRYNSWFKPTVAGPYAFHITGIVSDETDPKAGPLTMDETFVCGKGTLAENGHGFHCIEVPQAFPGRGHKEAALDTPSRELPEIREPGAVPEVDVERRLEVALRRGRATLVGFSSKRSLSSGPAESRLPSKGHDLLP